MRRLCAAAVDNGLCDEGSVYEREKIKVVVLNRARLVEIVRNWEVKEKGGAHSESHASPGRIVVWLDKLLVGL
jgi:hypothetical protein